MSRPLAKLELLMILNAVSKNVKILQIGPVEPKLLKREMAVVWNQEIGGIVEYL